MSPRRSRLPLSGLHYRWWFSVAVALACGTSTAQAGPDFTVHAFVNAYADGAGGQNVDTGEIAGPTATASIDLLGSQGREASIFAQASYGHLMGSAFATNSNGSAAAQATTYADDFMDTVTAISSLLSPGSSVQVRASVTFDNVLTGAGDTGAANAALTLGGALGPLGSFDDRGITGTISNHHQNTIVLTERVCIPFFISAGLGFDVSGRPGMGQLQADAVITLDVLTPFATLESASGTPYSSSIVPEPSSFVMLAGGLCGLVLLPLDVRFVNPPPVPIVTCQGLTAPGLVKDLRNGHLGWRRRAGGPGEVFGGSEEDGNKYRVGECPRTA